MKNCNFFCSAKCLEVLSQRHARLLAPLANVNVEHGRGGFRRVVKFLEESNSFHIKSKVIKMLSCKNVAALLDPPLAREV